MPGAAPRLGHARTPSWRSALVLGGVITLHAVLVWMLHGTFAGRAQGDAQPALIRRVTLRLIPLPPPPTPTKPMPETTPARSSTSRPAAAHTRGPKLPAAGETSPSAAPLARTAASVSAPEAALRADPPASAPIVWPSLLETDASRRAIRASARTPGIAGQAVAAIEGPRPASAQERLATGVKSAGKGDCLKGEYAGSGMGILSVPLIVLAAARGACAQ